MKVRIFNDGQPAYMTTVTDVETKEELRNVTDVDMHISVKDPWPYALIKVAVPCVDVILDAEIRRVCPCCGRDWQPPTPEVEEKRYFPDLFSPEDKGRTMQELVLDALSTDETHHKQWYLWRIAEALEIDTSPLDFIGDKGIAP